MIKYMKNIIRDHIFQWIMASSRRAPRKANSFSVLKGRAVPVDCIVDVGVLQGTKELINSYPELYHYLFEPVMECNPAISQSYRYIRHEVINAAVGLQGQAGHMYCTGGAGESGSSAKFVPGGASSSEVTIKTVSLDRYFEGCLTVNNAFLKIDTDGNEENVILGATDFIMKCSVVMVETTSTRLVPIVSLMQDRGFVVFDIVEPCYYDEALWQCDIIFIRKEIFEEKFEIIGEEGFDSRKYSIF
jgi:FkbM family methyltransferase